MRGVSGYGAEEGPAAAAPAEPRGGIASFSVEQGPAAAVPGQPSAASFDSFARASLSAPARLMAALAVVQERGPKAKAAAMGYRLAEFCANVVCLFCVLWVVWHWAVLALFALLWYLPAAWRTGSLWRPIRLPLLNFVVDDFSLLGVHPKPRPAHVMHAICLLRVLVLIVVIPAFAASTNVPEWMKILFSNENAIHILFQGKPLHGESIPERSLLVWAVFAIIMLALAALWALLVSVMLLAACRGSGPLSWEKNKLMLGKIDELASLIDLATSQSDWRACLHMMRNIQGDHPSLKLTTVAKTFGPAVGTLVHLALDVAVAHTFFSHGLNNPESFVPDCTLGSLTILNMLFTLLHNTLVGGSPWAIAGEAWRSFERGALTETYVRILYGDLGAHVLPALAIKIFGLPFCADNTVKVATGILAIVGTIPGSVPFIFQQFDLGIEREGFVEEQTSLAQAREPSAAAAPTELSQEELEGVSLDFWQRLF
mmetsp:Transcript_19442/g.60143  ORF Transcript_19442/g.60143 Transcript_19442/m.60143 type:complete len:485 (-) Transcript_19442:71-1525(-)